MVFGIDVSTWQGTDIDWEKVKAAGVKFAILRAGFGKDPGQEDNAFETNYAGAKAAGIPVGVYWYSYSDSPERSRKEAENCLNTLKGRKLDFPVFYDMEYESEILAVSNEVRTASVNAFCETIRAAGFAAGIYASLEFLESKLNMGAITCPVWCAQYFRECQYPNWTVWQYTSGGKVDGVNGPCDLDYMQDWYFADAGKSSPVLAHVKKSLSVVAQEVLDGKYGNGEDRVAALTKAGYDYDTVQAEVNRILQGKKYFCDLTVEELEIGSTGDAVTALQVLLNGFGYPTGGIDGIFGDQTNAAVILYQSKHGIIMDGIVGPATWASLLGKK